MKGSAAEKEFAKALGLRLTKQRRLRGLSQAGLARRVGVATQTVFRWEQGLHIPNVWDWGKLRKVLKAGPEVKR